ncbi:MAG: nucleotidyl transferase AbiEii/AbiGii toxin family protein [Candidatus Acetothermia bacterium]|jgi:hypothetical protein|nr:nucleotidyl transferase AbiEii/AbiGii toxin family protein [Candidatus Acetothermia bacterium]
MGSRARAEEIVARGTYGAARLRIGSGGRFFLTGGTALAEFYLGHRRSFALDLFTAEEGLVLPFSRLFENQLGDAGFEVRTVRRRASFAEFTVKIGAEEVRVQLAYDSPFRFHPPEEAAFVRVNDFVDLAVDKFLAFFGRAEPRDAVDLFFLLREPELKGLMELARRKDPGFDPYWLAQAFQRVEEFPDEPERWPVEMVASWDPQEIKARFTCLARSILEGIQKGEQG